MERESLGEELSDEQLFRALTLPYGSFREDFELLDSLSETGTVFGMDISGESEARVVRGHQ